MNEKAAAAFQTDFFRRCPGSHAVMRLFDVLPHVFFYAKDHASRFVKVNHLFLENKGLQHEWQAIGKTDRDFFPPVMAEAYIAEDQRVMESGEISPGQVWQVLFRQVSPRWYVSTKAPLFDTLGRVIGLTGAMYRIEEPKVLAQYFQELMPVVDFVNRNYGESISMVEMARLAGLSSTHFNRRFKQLLRFTPTDYLRTVRIQAAQQLLAATSRSLSDIATSVGFTDQSHFTRRFRETTGLTPEVYRRRFVQTPAG